MKSVAFSLCKPSLMSAAIANGLRMEYTFRSTHVPAVIGGEGKPERMLSDFKAYATRSLRCATIAPGRRRYWTDHGSTRYLWNETSLNAAIDYVLNGQGTRMACYPERSDTPDTLDTEPSRGSAPHTPVARKPEA
jgi:hypothetical protein